MLFALKMLGYQKFECWIILCVTILQLQRYEQIHKFQQTRTRIGKSVMLWDAKKKIILHQCVTLIKKKILCTINTMTVLPY